MSLTSSNHESKSGQKSSSIATTTTTPTKTAIKTLPGKIEKKVKHQFHRLSGVLHHVIHPHHHTVRNPAFSVTSPSSPIFYPINVVRAFLPPDHSSPTGSVHSRGSWDAKYPKEDDSIDELPVDDSIDLSLSVGDSSITQIEEPHLPQKEPQLILHEQDSSSVPTVASPVEIRDPILVDDEEEKDSPSKEGVDEEKVPSDANSQRVLPPQAVPLDVPSSSDADPILIDDNEEKDLPSKEAVEENAPSDPKPQQALPPQAVPFDLPSSLEASTPPLEPEITDLIDDNEEKDSLSKEVDEKTPSDANSQQISSPQAVPSDLPSSPDAGTPQLQPEIPDPILIDNVEKESLSDKEEEDSPTKEEVDEGKAPSDANSEQVSPPKAVPFDLSSSPDASTPQLEPETPDPTLIDNKEEKGSSLKEVDEEKAPLGANPQQVSPSQAVPFDLPSSPDASTLRLEPEIPDSILTDDREEKDPLSEKADEEKAPSDAESQHVLPSQNIPLPLPSPGASIPQPQALSDANSQQEVSPSQAVPTVLSSSPEASIPQPQAALPNVQKGLPPPSETKEEVPDIDVPAFIVPPTFLPMPNIHRSFSSNLLTWWLPVSPLPLLPVSQHFSLLRRILTSRRLWLLLLLLLIRDSTAPLAAVETIALFATF